MRFIYTKDMSNSGGKILYSVIKLLSCSVIGCLLTVSAMAQHSPQYSQYMFNGLALNPAYAGSKEVLNIAAIYRSSQWGSSFEGAPVTQTFAGDFPLQNPNLALGLMIFNDRINIIKQSGAYFAYCYRISTGEGKLSFGMQAGFDLMREDQTNIITLQPDDPMFNFESNNSFMPNVGVGTYYYTSNVFAGLSLPQFLTYSPQSAGSYKAKPTLTNTMLYGGTIIPVSRDFKLKPSTLMRFTGKGILIDFNCNVIMFKDLLELGVSWRTGTTFVALAQFRINSLYIGYAHDYAIGKPSAINASHEIMLRYDFKIRVKAASPLFFLN